MINIILALLGAAYMIDPIRRGISQITNKFWPNELLDPTALATLKRRDILGKIDYYLELRKAGFDRERALALYNLTEQRLDVSSALSTIRRYPEDEEKARKELKDQGWTDDRIEMLYKLTKFFPSPPDITMWMGREVFEPTTIEKIGLEEEWDIVYKHGKDYFDKVGVEEKEAKNYWIAHWRHPALMQMREMIWRGIVPKEIFMIWSKLVEFPPYWREGLYKILFRPYTRVDVRRMHKIGVLKDEDLPRAYMDIGFDEEKAKKMAEFTIEYNKEPPQEEKTAEDLRKDELKGLTRSWILRSFKKGRIDESTAKDYLLRSDLPPEVVDFYIEQIKFEEEEERVEEQIRLLRRKFLNGVITFTELQNEIGALNLTDAERERILDAFSDEKEAKVSLPSKTDLVKMVKAKIISLDEFIEMMGHLGYIDKYINWYIKLFKLA